MNSSFFKNKSILITGGTGSFGQKFAETILTKFKNIKKIVIYSRDEFKQFQMSKKFARLDKNKKLRFFLGDIRDSKRFEIALNGIDYVVHAAAIKQVDTSEYNPIEYIKTNVIGAQNIVEACAQNKNVRKIIALSTDKASSPINLYGATKLCSDKLFIAANNFTGSNKFTVIRYGNVAGSRGSVIPFFLSQKKTGLITITDKRMTRFNITLEDSVNLVISSIINSVGGEIIIPKLKSYKILDLAHAICNNCKIKFVGKRPGEKLNEEMIASDDSSIKVDMGKFYMLVPSYKIKLFSNIIKKFKGKILPQNFEYKSGQKQFLSTKELVQIIKKI